MSWHTLIPVRPVRLWSVDPNQSRRASWLELFFDLIFVAAVAQVGVPLSEDDNRALVAFLKTLTDERYLAPNQTTVTTAGN